MEPFLTEFLECVRIQRENSAYATGKRGFCVLSLRLSGRAKFVRNETITLAGPDNLLFFPANISYFQSCEKEELIAVHFKSSEFAFREIMPIVPKDIALIRSLFLSLYDAWSAMAPGYEFRCRSIFYELMYQVKAELSPTPGSRISPSVDYMRQNYQNPGLTLAEIAAASSVSQVYFRKLFKRSYGKSPVQYLNELRIGYAKALLRGGYFTVVETAGRAGFNSPKYFSKVFFQLTGITPGKYV